MKLLRTLLTAGLATVAFAATLQAQPVVDQEGDMGLGTLEPHPSAILDLTSTTKGFLGPRMTTVQRDAIAAPAAGLVIYNTDDSEYQYFDGFLWIPIGLTAGPFWELDGNSVSGQYVGGGPGNGEFIGTIDGNDMSIATTVAANIDFWTSDVERFSIDAATGDIVPTVTNTISLGTDANRFADVFVDGASVHVGDAIGAELVVGYAANVGTLNVDGSASPQIAMDAATAQVNVDPAGDGTINFFVSEALGVAGFDVDSDGNGELGIGPLLGGIVMDANSDGVFDVEVDLAGDLIANNNAQVTGDLNVDGVTTLDETTVDGTFDQTGGGQVTISGNVDANLGVDVDGGNLTVADPHMLIASGAANSIGDGNGGTQLTVDGDGAANTGNGYELVVEGDAEIQGTLGLTGLTDGSVLFIENGGEVTEDNANFFWDDANDRLGLGTAGPAARLHAASVSPDAAAQFDFNFLGGDAVIINHSVVGGGAGLRVISGGAISSNAAVFAHTSPTGNAVEISTTGADDALQVTAGTGLAIDANGGAIDGDAAANMLGDGAAAQQLTVRGTADAVVGNTLGANPTVWDLVVTGDAVTTGIIKSGGSLWIDGVSATHSVTANQPLDVNTLGANDLTLSTNSTNAVVVDGGTQNVNILNDLDVDTDLNVDGTTTLDETTVDGTFDQTGGGDVNFSGNVDADGGLDVTGDLTQTGGQVTFTGNVDANGGLDVMGTTTMVGALTQNTGNVTFAGNVTMNGLTNTVNGTNFNVNATGITALASPTTNITGTTANLNSTTTNITGTLNASGTNNLTGATNITNGGSLAGVFTGNPTLSGNPAFTGTPTFTNIDVNGGAIDGTVIGGTTPAAGTFTTVTTTAPGSVIGDGTDATQLTVNGVDAGAVEVVINGDLSVSGNFTLGGIVLTSDLDMNGNNIVDNADGIVNVNDDFAVSGAATVNSLAVTTTSTFTGLATFNGGVTILGASNIGGTPVFTAASQFNAASTWGGPGAPTTMVNQGRVDIEANAGATAATAALEAENTFANGMAIHVPVGGGRTILSHGTGAGAVAIPGDVTVYEATGAGNPGLPAAATDGQILYIINTSGGNITPTGGTGTITLIPNNDARAYVYSGGWYEMP